MVKNLNLMGIDADSLKALMGLRASELGCTIEAKIGGSVALSGKKASVVELERSIREFFGTKVLDEDIYGAVFSRLVEARLTISFVESCTGGLLAYHLTRLAGASDVFAGSYICYSDEFKARTLGIDIDLIDKHGVVSEVVALAMADRMQNISHADIVLSSTGIAGPSGGTARTPLGTVYIGLATSARLRSHITSELLTLSGSREEIQEEACIAAYKLALNTLGQLC